MKNEKVKDINETKIKKINKKQILSIVAMLMIVFLGVNIYAISQGYDNVFFMIKDFSTKNEILKDQDITISYKPIEIAEGIEVQFNRFMVKDNEAVLFMNVNQNAELELDKRIIQVEVTNGEDNSQLITETIKEDKNVSSYTKKIKNWPTANPVKQPNNNLKSMLNIGSNPSIYAAGNRLDKVTSTPVNINEISEYKIINIVLFFPYLS